MLDMECHEQLFFYNPSMFSWLFTNLYWIPILDTFEIKVIHSQVDWTSTFASLLLHLLHGYVGLQCSSFIYLNCTLAPPSPKSEIE